MSDDKLSPHALRVDTRLRSDSKTDTSISAVSDPFLTPIVGSRNPSIVESNPLQPDPGSEGDFEVADNPFAFSPGQLNKLFNPKSLAAYVALGGLEGIARGLQTDVQSGLNLGETSAPKHVTLEDAVSRSLELPAKPRTQNQPSPTTEAFGDRIRVYNRNVLPSKEATPLWKLMWAAYCDPVLILLTAAAVISLALGLYETFGVEHEAGAPVPIDWVEGVAICVAIAIVTLVGSLNDWQKEKAFVKLNDKKEERMIKVIRSGKSTMISVHEVLVGDVLHLEPGDLVPVDGILIDCHDLKCDESSATGESDALKKTSGNVVWQELRAGSSGNGLDPFIISGAKVLEGNSVPLCELNITLTYYFRRGHFRLHICWR